MTWTKIPSSSVKLLVCSRPLSFEMESIVSSGGLEERENALFLITTLFLACSKGTSDSNYPAVNLNEVSLSSITESCKQLGTWQGDRAFDKVSLHPLAIEEQLTSTFKKPGNSKSILKSHRYVDLLDALYRQLILPNNIKPFQCPSRKFTGRKTLFIVCNCSFFLHAEVQAKKKWWK